MVLLLALAVFFTSGFAALLYQVIWQRMLVIFSGADVYSATLIVAAFMTGLGAGNLAGGHIADRLSRRASLILFGLAELAIAGFGIFSAALYYDLLYQRMGHLHIAPGVVAGILFASLLWPTFFMGASLPLLARSLTERIERAAFTVGTLYGFNTLGAAMGAMVATWWLLPRLGLEGSLQVGAILNLVCAAVLLPVALLFTASRADAGLAVAADAAAPPAAERAAPPETSPRRFTFWVWAAIFGFSGLLALSLEIVWFRLLGVMMKSTAFTFGTLLALYLSGLGLGSVAGSVIALRVRRPALAFLALQAAATLSAGGLLAVFIGVVDGAGWLWSYFGSYEPLNVRESVGTLPTFMTSVLSAEAPDQLALKFLALYFVLPALLVVPTTFLMGCSFPFLQQVVQTDLARVGRRVGVLLLANIVGSMLGSVLTGWVLLDLFGTANTLKLLAAMGGLFVLFGLRFTIGTRTIALGRQRVPALRAAAGGTVMLMVPILASMPDSHTLWARLHGTGVDRIIVGEDGSGVSVIKRGSDGRATVFVNGVGQSTMPYGGVHTALGAIPAFVHPAPRDAAIIGLGSGDTVYAVAGRPEIEKVTCVEIIRPQLDTLQELLRRWPYGGLRGLLQDPRIEHVFGDGRIFLMRGGRKYDIIEADALRPSSAYSGNLYSDEYFALVRDHLKPNGLAATWLPTERVHNAFVRVFPFVVSIPGILLGSSEPIEIDREAIARRLAAVTVRHYYEAAGIDIEKMMTSYLAEPARYGPDFPRDTLTDFNTDLFPKDEYDLARPRP